MIWDPSLELKVNCLRSTLTFPRQVDTVSNVNAPTEDLVRRLRRRSFSEYVYAGRILLAAADPITEQSLQQLDSPLEFTAVIYWRWSLGSQLHKKQFLAIGNKTYTLGGGVDYRATGGDGMKASLGDLITAYGLLLQ